MIPNRLYNEQYPRFTPGEGQIRRLVIRSRFNAMTRVVRFQPGDRVLEVGCDQGVLLRMIERTGATVHGIDVNEDAIRRARHPRIRHASGEAIPFPDQSFDVCVTSHVIEHLPRPRKLLCEARRVLRPEGKLILIYPWELFRGMSVIPDVLVRGVPLSKLQEIHLHVFTPRSLQALASELSLEHCYSRMFLGFPSVFPQYLTILQRSAAEYIGTM
jgi:ubiquinone/menaquinone biosynthesis C-methylase UbiE